MSTGHSLEDLFVIERETHIKALIEGFRSLKTGQDVPGTLTKMFRAAHSLKGAARLLGNKQIEDRSHTLEEGLKRLETSGAVTQGDLSIISGHIEELGGRLQLATEDLSGNAETASPHGSLLHINSEHIAELIQLASELAVITRRIDGKLSGQILAAQNQQDRDLLQQESQRASIVATALQRLSYRLRLTPLLEIAKGLPVVAATLATQLGKEINFRIVNGNTLIDRDLLRSLEPCLIQLLKNSIDHGLESPNERTTRNKPARGSIVLSAKQYGAVVEIEFRDDGAGIDPEFIRSKVVARGHHDSATAEALTHAELLEFLFLPGFSTRDRVSELSGRGIGLDIVKATLRELGGDVTIKSQVGMGTTFCMRIPSRIASFRSLLFRCGNAHVGVPLSFVDRILDVRDARIEEMAGFPMLRIDSREIPLVEGRQVLRVLGELTPEDNNRHIVVLASGDTRLAVVVDALEGEQELVIQPLDQRYQGVRHVLGIAGGLGGRIITIVNPEHILAEPLSNYRGTRSGATNATGGITRQRVLVVDDSLTVRELERRLLEQAGFDCDTAVDGIDGLEKLQEQHYSMVVTDLDMPRLDGFGLIEQVRAAQQFKTLPILVVSYKERDEDRQRGIALGANGYLSKGSFKDSSFITTIRALLDEGAQ